MIQTSTFLLAVVATLAYSQDLSQIPQSVDDQFLGSDWEVAGGGAGFDSLAAGQSRGSDAAANWGLNNVYGAQDNRQAAAANAAGVASRAVGGQQGAAYQTLDGYDRGHSDQGFRDEAGQIDYGRNTGFSDSARNAQLDISSSSSGGRMLDADQAGYAGAARSGSVAGGVAGAGSLWDQRAATAEISAAQRAAAARGGWGGSGYTQQQAAWPQPSASTNFRTQETGGSNLWNSPSSPFQPTGWNLWSGNLPA